MLKNFLTTKITRQELKKFIQKHSSDKLTLDLGCSNSPYSKYFSNRVGFDIQDGKGVDIIGDAHNLPFEDEKFDVVLCTEVLEHLYSPHIAISEMKRVLKLKGKLILTTRFIFPIHDSPNDFFRYTKYGLRYLFKDWSIESLQEESNTVEALFVLLQRIGYQTELKMNKITKFFLFLFVKSMPVFSFFVKKEYGDIQREKIEKIIMTSGYYLVCKK